MILDEIVQKTREELENRKKEYPLEWLGRSLAYNPYMPRDVKKALQSTPERPYRIIAEVKKASPSKGIIREDFEPVSIAKAYELGGADALSILTEPHYFKGNLEYITQVRRYVPMPLLRKDFIIDSYQILEALVYGADFILLIAAALKASELKELLEYARHLGLEVLVEIHNREDLTKAIWAGADIIGINHRDLQTFEMHMNLCHELIPLIPQGKIIVAESGLSSSKTLEELHGIGVDAFLIGEHFMRQKDVTQALLDIYPLNKK
jgi:indole-3-glycerol phosphate synthase